MAKAELKGTALVVLTMMMAGRASAQGEPAIVLHVVNHANLATHVLEGARARVAKIYEGIGVRTVWVDSEEPTTQLQDGGLLLRIVLLSSDGQRKISPDSSDYVLGLGHLPSWRAYIFCDRIATLSGVMSFPIRLGNVIAHEIGHLVLRTRVHSRLGIMRADSDVYSIHLENFDETQVRAIQLTMAAASLGSLR